MSCDFLFLKSHDDHRLIKVSKSIGFTKSTTPGDLMTLISIIRVREEDGDFININ